ncbi:thermonuclease family protein [Salmonella enterica]|nr:thermonuclease family protein [Salmonella enterica]
MFGMKAVRLTLTTVIFAVSLPAWADFNGEVVRVLDGDTIDVLTDNKQVRVRLVGIDAPEKQQAFGQRARQYLAGLTFRRSIRVVEQETDRYGRTLGVVWIDGQNINAAMVQQGMAWAYRYHERATDPAMLNIETQARTEKVGLWSDPHAIEPWKWRHQKKKQGEIE